MDGIHDMEDLVALGQKLGACPYYGTRASVRDAHVVALPYSMLFRAEARAALARLALPRSWVVSQAPKLECDLLRVKPSARTHTAAPHCDSHCQQLRVCFNTPIFLWRQAAPRP